LQTEKQQMDEWETWVSPFLNMYEVIDLILSLIRVKGLKKEEMAKKGFFQLSLSNQGICQLLNIETLQKYHCFAEISGGRHRFTVRFMQAALEEKRPTQTAQDIPFSLTCCYL
jgi:cell division protein ZapD